MSKRSKPRFSIYFDCRRKLQDGSCPLRLRFTYHRKTRYIGLDSLHWLDKDIPTSLQEADWEKLDAKRPRGEWLAISNALNLLVEHADSIWRSLHPQASRQDLLPYDWDRFSDKFLEVPGEDSDVFFWFVLTYESAEQEKRHNTASIYRRSEIAIQRFSGPSLPLESITPQWLKSLEHFWLKEGRKYGGMAVDFRNLRAVYRQAMQAGAVSKDRYPFGLNGYTIKSGRSGQEKVLQWDELARLWFYSPKSGSLEEKALDFWKLSYLWQGVNPADMFRFKNQDVRGGQITFDRKKTVSTKRGGERVTIYVDGEAESIVKKWAIDESPEGYLLPVLKMGMTEKEIVDRVNNTRSSLNKQLKKIATKLELPRLSLSWARPTFATHMERHGANIREIQSALGHSNRATTEIYLQREKDIRESVKRAIPGQSK